MDGNIMTPLMKLLAGNLRDAYALGMIDCTEPDIDDFIRSAASQWSSASDQQSEYERAMCRIKADFHKKFRPIQAFRGRIIPFCNVMRLGVFSEYWLNELVPPPGHDAESAKKQAAKLARQRTPADANDLDALQDSFLRLSRWIKRAGVSGGRPGIRITIGALLDPAIRPFWVGGRVNRAELSAQYWRDRLGLVHLAADRRCCDELLVRMRYVAQMASDQLPRERHLEHRASKPASLWMLRPSIVHFGNRRFVQGVAADRKSRPARRGSTRDISTTDYAEGERELLLLAGEIADARLVGVDLLNGFPRSHINLDSDDDGFVDAIARQRHWN